MDTEREMQNEINLLRDLHNRPLGRDPVTGKQERVTRYRPGDRGYLPPAEAFVTIRFHNGLIVMLAEEFKKLPKAKQKKLTKW